MSRLLNDSEVCLKCFQAFVNSVPSCQCSMVGVLRFSCQTSFRKSRDGGMVAISPNGLVSVRVIVEQLKGPCKECAEEKRQGLFFFLCVCVYVICFCVNVLFLFLFCFVLFCFFVLANIKTIFTLT